MGTNVVPVKRPSRSWPWLAILATLVVSVAATFAIIRAFPQLLKLSAPADDPILMAGGSLTVRSWAGGHFNTTPTGATYVPADGTLSRFEILYIDASGLPAFATLPFGASDTAQFTFCPTPGTCASITARPNPGGHGMVIDPLPAGAVADGATTFTLNGAIQSVNFGGVSYGCVIGSAPSKCSVVLRYCRSCK